MNLSELKTAVVCLCLLASSAALASTGSIEGTIAFSGPAPKAEKHNRKSDVFCAKSDSFEEAIALSKDGKALANVVVRITQNAPEDAPLPTEPVVIDQTECVFRPRVQGAMEGQKVLMRNGDPTLHNVHGYLGQKTAFNVAQPPKGREIQREAKGGDVLRIKCDVHPWMTAYVVISKHPYFATSDAEGRFAIRVPPGTYTLEAWHEKLGTRTAEVTVEADKSVDPKFSFANKS
jgi:plastocyanin